MIFKDFNDFELIYLIKEHNEKALKLLIDKYEVILRKTLYDKKIYGYLYEELVLEGIFLLYKCVRCFDGVQNFYKYFAISVVRMIGKHLSKIRLNETIVSIAQIADVVENESERQYCHIEFENHLQIQIAEGIKNGYSLKEISKILDVDASKIYYEFSKMKKRSTIIKE